MNLEHGSGAGAISADGSTLALGAADDETALVLIDAASGQELRRIKTGRQVREKQLRAHDAPPWPGS